LDFKTKRPETVESFSRLVIDSTTALSVRIAVYGALEDPRLFHFEAPDKDSEQIFQTCIQMIHDREPALRGAGAALLHNISARVHLPARPDYLKRSSAAIREVMAAEQNSITHEYFNQFLQLISESIPSGVEVQ